VWAVVRRPAPRYSGVVLVVVAVFLAYLLGLLVGAMFGGIDLARAIAAAGAFATSWFAVVLASAPSSRAGRPSPSCAPAPVARWPWEPPAA
jgi:hypothetical protein